MTIIQWANVRRQIEHMFVDNINDRAGIDWILFLELGYI